MPTRSSSEMEVAGSATFIEISSRMRKLERRKLTCSTSSQSSTTIRVAKPEPTRSLQQVMSVSRFAPALPLTYPDWIDLHDSEPKKLKRRQDDFMPT